MFSLSLVKKADGSRKRISCVKEKAAGTHLPGDGISGVRSIFLTFRNMDVTTQMLKAAGPRFCFSVVPGAKYD